MKNVSRLVVLAGLSLAFAPAPFPNPDPNKRDLKKMKGDWVVSRMHNGGSYDAITVHGPRLIASVDDVVRITSQRMIFPPFNNEPVEFIFRLDGGEMICKSTTSPKRTSHARYEIDGDKLFICIYDPGVRRPEKVTVDRPGYFLLVLRRPKR